MMYIDKNALAERLDTRVAADLLACRVGAVGLAVMQGGQVLYKRYHGTACMATGQPLNDENGDDTLFRLASMTKPLTAVATLIQVAEGKLDLDEPISRLLPGFAHMDLGQLDETGHIVLTGSAHTPLTPRILLNHTNGIGTPGVGDVAAAGMTDDDNRTIANAVDYIARQPLAFEPATAQFYSALWAFDVLARLCELTSGLDYATFLSRRVLEPCGMSHTTFDPTPDQWSRIVAMHNREEVDGVARSVDRPMIPGCVFEDLPTTRCSGGAGLVSTLPDYMRFADMLRRRGVTAGGVRILPERLVAEMATTTIPHEIMPAHERWGLGVRVIVSDEYFLPRHSFGWSGAYGTHFWIDPTNDVVAVLMRNGAYDGGAGAAMACQFERDVYGG